MYANHLSAVVICQFFKLWSYHSTWLRQTNSLRMLRFMRTQTHLPPKCHYSPQWFAGKHGQMCSETHARAMQNRSTFIAHILNWGMIEGHLTTIGLNIIPWMHHCSDCMRFLSKRMHRANEDGQCIYQEEDCCFDLGRTSKKLLSIIRSN